MTPIEAATSASAFRAGSDELGVYAQVSVDPNVFSDTAIFKTAYWFTDQYYIYFARDTDTHRFHVEFRLKQTKDDPEKLKAACGEFCNKLLDYQLRETVLVQTAAVRETLVRKAFFEAKATLPTPATSNEAMLPHPGAAALG